MRKRLLYIGALLFLIGIASAFMSLLSLQSITPAGLSPKSERLTLGANALGDVPVVLNQSGVIVLSYNATNGVDFYLANQSAAAALGGANGTDARVVAAGLEGRGVYDIYEDSSAGTTPYYAGAGSSSPAYVANLSVFPAGTYHALFSNRGGGNATVLASYAAISAAALNSTALSTIAYGGISFILLVAGFIIAVASFFMKDRNAAQPERLDEEARKEYERIERGGARGKGGKPKGPKARKE